MQVTESSGVDDTVEMHPVSARHAMCGKGSSLWGTVFKKMYGVAAPLFNCIVTTSSPTIDRLA